MTIHVHYSTVFFVNIKFIYKHLVHYKLDKRRRYSHFELSASFFYFPKSKGAITMMIRSEDKNNFTCGKLIIEVCDLPVVLDVFIHKNLPPYGQKIM